MYITILRRSNKGLQNINLSAGHLLLLLVINIIALPLIAAWSGYQFATNSTSDYQQLKTETVQWQEKYLSEKDQFEDYRKYSESHLDGLAARIGSLQAEINRINAVGERILELNGLDSSEFDFSQKPSLGGPLINLPETSESKEKVFENIDVMQSILENSHDQFKIIESLLINNQIGAEKYISGRPIKKGWMSSGYGKRIDPFKGVPAWHQGVDFAGKEGSSITATASGVVTWAGERYGYGLLVEVNHGDGMATRYAHCKELVVKKGDLVTKGQLIAKMGSSGRSTGPHVHYEVLKKGKPVNPLKYVYRKAKKPLAKKL